MSSTTPQGRLENLVLGFINGGTGTASVVLLPRVWSVFTQWLVAGLAGTAMLTDYVTTTSRGSAAVSLIAAALAPVLLHRKAAMRTADGRAMIAAALVVLALFAFCLAFTFEVGLGLGWSQALFTAGFAAMTLLGAPAVVLWPSWQARGRFVPLALVTVILLVVGSVIGVIGSAKFGAVVIASASALPALAMLGRARGTRAVRYAVSVARRAIPPSSMSFATALVFPMSLQLGTTLFGPKIVGDQLLFWPLAMALNIASQAVAARTLTTRSGDSAPRGLAAWGVGASGLTVVAAIGFAALRFNLSTPSGGSPLPLGMLVAAAAFIYSDPICLYFSPPSGWRTVAFGSVAAALLVGAAVVLWPDFMLGQYSVCGPSAIVATLRLGFVSHPSLRLSARVALVVLLSGFILSAGFR